MQFRDLGAQYLALKSQIDAGIADVLQGQQFIGGPQIGMLEAKLAEYVGAKQCITCANGTDALHLALMAWGIGPGDAVFVPDFTFFSSGEVVALQGAMPVFVDICADTFNIDPVKLEEAICTVKEQGRYVPRVVVAVDLFGRPADYLEIRRICDERGLLLLEDGAQGFGGTIGKQRACSFGDISTTSFFPAKPLGCYGDGGAIFTDNDEWAALMRSIKVHGKGMDKYDNVRIGLNSRLDTLQAAILLPKLDAFVSHEIADVNAVAAWYTEALAGATADSGLDGLVLPQIPEGIISSWAQYTVLLPAGIDRSAVQEALKGQGIPTSVYYPRPMHTHRAFADAQLCFDGCLVTTQVCKRCLALPMGPYVAREDVERVSLALQEALRE